MKTYMRIMASLIAAFCSIHSYLWAFGWYEPKHEGMFGIMIIIGYCTALGLFMGSFEAREERTK